MEKYRIIVNCIIRLHSDEIHKRDRAIRGVVNLAQENPSFAGNISIQKFVDGEWTSDILAAIEADDIIENGEEEIECDFNPPCESCKQRAANKQ
jgi:hypothetical protein